MRNQAQIVRPNFSTNTGSNSGLRTNFGPGFVGPLRLPEKAGNRSAPVRPWGVQSAGNIGRTPKGRTLRGGVLGKCRKPPSQNPFSAPLLRTPSQNPFSEPLLRTPSQNPVGFASQNPFSEPFSEPICTAKPTAGPLLRTLLRTLPRTFSELFLERCVAVRPLRRAPNNSQDLQDLKPL